MGGGLLARWCRHPKPGGSPTFQLGLSTGSLCSVCAAPSRPPSQVLATYDADNNGRLEFGEFNAFMLKNTGSIQARPARLLRAAPAAAQLPLAPAAALAPGARGESVERVLVSCQLRALNAPLPNRPAPAQEAIRRRMPSFDDAEAEAALAESGASMGGTSTEDLGSQEQG